MFVWYNQINMSRFINGKVGIDTNILNILGLNMEPNLDLLNTRKIPNTVAIEGLYISLILVRIHSFSKVYYYIIFIIGGQCFVLLGIISFVEKWLDVIAPLSERDMLFGVQVYFLERIYTRFPGGFIGSLKTYIYQAPSIQDTIFCRYPLTEDRSVVPEYAFILFGRILVVSLTHM